MVQCSERSSAPHHVNDHRQGSTVSLVVQPTGPSHPIGVCGPRIASSRVCRTEFTGRAGHLLLSRRPGGGEVKRVAQAAVSPDRRAAINWRCSFYWVAGRHSRSRPNIVTAWENMPGPSVRYVRLAPDRGRDRATRLITAGMAAAAGGCFSAMKVVGSLPRGLFASPSSRHRWSSSSARFLAGRGLPAFRPSPWNYLDIAQQRGFAKSENYSLAHRPFAVVRFSPDFFRGSRAIHGAGHRPPWLRGPAIGLAPHAGGLPFFLDAMCCAFLADSCLPTGITTRPCVAGFENLQFHLLYPDRDALGPDPLSGAILSGVL